MGTDEPAEGILFGLLNRNTRLGGLGGDHVDRDICWGRITQPLTFSFPCSISIHESFACCRRLGMNHFHIDFPGLLQNKQRYNFTTP